MNYFFVYVLLTSTELLYLYVYLVQYSSVWPLLQIHGWLAILNKRFTILHECFIVLKKVNQLKKDKLNLDLIVYNWSDIAKLIISYYGDVTIFFSSEDETTCCNCCDISKAQRFWNCNFGFRWVGKELEISSMDVSPVVKLKKHSHRSNSIGTPQFAQR